MAIRNFRDKVKRYFWFTQQELSSALIMVVVLAIMASWDSWGIARFDPSMGARSLLIAFAVIALTVFIHHASQRLLALKLGFRVEHALWWPGLIVAFLLTVVTQGRILVLVGSGFFAHLLPAHRMGAFRYGTNVSTLAKIALAGPVANVLFATAMKALELGNFASASISDPLFKTGLAFAAWNLLPIPPLDGSKIFFASRLLYVFLFASIASYVALISLFGTYSYIIALTIGIIAWFLFYQFFEKKWK